ncbi:MAG: flavodoxin family protein, partial [Candidatus Methanoplasma sp.]|nr:flavodoxin family protein [Candidatus Methanoplasma sp.]
TTSERLGEFSGIVLGSPVHYAGPASQLTSFLDRLFYSSGYKMPGKVGAAIVSCRRGGGTAAFDRLNKYFSITSMPVASSQYWNQVHGMTPDDVRRDKEGLQTMRTLAQNMAWLMKCIEAGKNNGINIPEYEPKQITNFIMPE